MTDAHDFPALHAVNRSAENPAEYSWHFLRLFPVTGASVSTVGEVLGSQTISASDSLAARIDELQFDLGEGPCWDAMNFSRPILVPNLIDPPTPLWPAFRAAIDIEQVSSLFAFPLVVGSLKIGAVDLYANSAANLSAEQTDQASAMAKAIGKHVFRRALAESGQDFDDDGNAYSRRTVHQATGMVLAQLRISAEDALLIIQGQAFGSNRRMMDVATDVVERRLAFVRTPHGIEATHG